MDTATAAWIGFLGAIVGGLIGGVASFLGNRQGAEHAYELHRKWNEETARKQVIQLLKHTLHTANVSAEIYNDVKAKGIDIKIHSINLYIYDDEWPAKLALAGMTDDEHEIIIKWFTQIELISEDSQVLVEQLVSMAENHQSKIKEVISKYETV